MKVPKTDGSFPQLNAIEKVIRKKKESPEWRGESSGAGGRPCALSDGQKQEIIDLVFQERGRAVVTINYIKKKLRFARKVGKDVIRRTLHEAGLKWLTRRLKSAVPPAHKPSRLAYCAWILKQRQPYLERFAYTDGTTFYLARGPQVTVR